MLEMAAGQLGDPMIFVVLVKTGEGLVHDVYFSG
jgi:hypothetical protein